MRPGLLIIAGLSLVDVLLVTGCSVSNGSQSGSDAAGGPVDGSAPGDNAELTTGNLIIAQRTVPPGLSGTFTFTSVLTRTISSDATLVVIDLDPGTYTTTETDRAPEFDLAAVECDDGDGATPSSADAATRTAILNLDPGATVMCTFVNTRPGDGDPSGRVGVPGDDSPADDGAGPGINPFGNPDDWLEPFPLPDELPPGADTFATPKPGLWIVTNGAGQMDCSIVKMPIAPSPGESRTLEVLDGGQTIVATGLEDSEGVPTRPHTSPAIAGSYSGSFQAREQGVPVVIDHTWQVVTDEYVAGHLTSTFTCDGATCTVYRPFELVYSRQ